MKVLLVDDEEQVLKGVSRIISCEEEDWEVATAGTGEAALEILSESSFDVVVSDMRMRGMDGAELLDQIEGSFPRIMRVVLSAQADRETVLRAVKPMHRYLSKPCDPDQLFQAINRTSIFQETIKSSEVLDAIGRANCLPSFPEVVIEINEETSSANSNSKSIAKIVAKDPILSAKVLQLANSAIFSVRQIVADIDHAVSMLGLDMVRSLAMSQAVYKNGKESSNRVLSARQLFDHGFAVAVTGRKLAKFAKMSTEESNFVFTAALLHDVGKLILLNAFPEKYQMVVEAAKNEKCNIEELELETFGATHQGVGAYLFELWGLPAEVTEAVAAHHSFNSCAKSLEKTRQLVFAANWIVRDRPAAELKAWVEESENDEAELFASQIVKWQEHVNSTNEEAPLK